jgi:hypothetical protein
MSSGFAKTHTYMKEVLKNYALGKPTFFNTPMK